MEEVNDLVHTLFQPVKNSRLKPAFACESCNHYPFVAFVLVPHSMWPAGRVRSALSEWRNESTNLELDVDLRQIFYSNTNAEPQISRVRKMPTRE
jgi:hypothetical protein